MYILLLLFFSNKKRIYVFFSALLITQLQIITNITANSISSEKNNNKHRGRYENEYYRLETY